MFRLVQSINLLDIYYDLNVILFVERVISISLEGLIKGFQSIKVPR